MSLVGMRKMMHGKLHIFMWCLALVFAVGWIGLVVGSGRSGLKDTEQSGVVAIVNGQKIDRTDFETRAAAEIKRVEDQSQRTVGAFEEAQMRGQLFDKMVDRIMRMDAAKAEGVRVRGGDIKRKINEVVDSQIAQIRSRMLPGSTNQTDAALDAALRKNNMSLSQVKDQVRASIDEEMVREQLTMEGLVKKLQDKIDSSDATVRASYDEVRFSQITVDGKKRSMDQARTQANEISAKLKKGDDFAAIAKESSDDPFKVNGGKRVDYMRKTYMEKELADKLFSMKVGDVSDPIQLAQAFVIVKLDDKRSALPADYTDPKKQKEYKDAYITQQQYMAQSQFMYDLQSKVKVDVKDPELQAYMATKALSAAMGQGPAQAKMKAEEAINDLRKATQQNTGDPAAMARIYSQLAYLYQWLQSPSMFSSKKEETAKYQAEEKKALDDALTYTESNDLRNMMVAINIKEGAYDKALENLTFVSDNAMDDPTVHSQLMAKYKELKKHLPAKVAPLIAAEEKWLADYNKQQEAAKKQQEALKKQQGGMVTQPQAQPKGGTTTQQPGVMVTKPVKVTTGAVKKTR